MMSGSLPLPPTIAMAFAPVDNVAQAQAITGDLARSHYENFSVISRLLPKHLRQDFCNVYAFCRVADDLGDEVGDTQKALEYLGNFKQQTHECYAGNSTTAVFVALSDTIKRHDIPIQPYLDLIDAFEQDQRVLRYDTFEQVLDYCRRSADPVGRLVLYMCGYRDEQRQKLSDKTCSALQVTNFWQDVRRDILERNRIYLPSETMDKFGVTEQQIIDGRCDEKFRRAMQFEVDRAEVMFNEGEKLLPLLDKSIRKQISLFSQGGRAILQAIRKQNYDTLTRRPALSKMQKMKLIFSAMVGG